MHYQLPDTRYIVETEKIAHNIAVLRQQANYRRIYAVMKANGYGLGCADYTAVCVQNGLHCFAVTNLREAEKVCSFGAEVEELLLMSSAEREQITRLLELGVTFTVASCEDAKILAPYGVRAHIKVDTGMGRRGFAAEDTAVIIDLYKQFPGIQFTGIYTQFCDGANRKRCQTQFGCFQMVLLALEKAGISPGVRHCCNSAAAFYQEDMLLDGIRAGSAILGRIRQGSKFGLEKTGICQVRIEAVRQLPKGATVGYGGIFRARKAMTVALCPIGTHHGIGIASRNGVQNPKEWLLYALRMLHSDLTGKGVPAATIHGMRCNALGCICSEAVILDVTGVPCQPGDLALFDINPMLLHDVPVEFV